MVLRFILHHDHNGLRESLIPQGLALLTVIIILIFLLKLPRIGPAPPCGVPFWSEGQASTRVGSVEGEVRRAGGMGEGGVEEALKCVKYYKKINVIYTIYVLVINQ